MEKAKAQDNLEEVRWVDSIDEINNLVAYLHFISDMWPEGAGEVLRLSPNGSEGLVLLLMNIGNRLQKASDTLYKTLTNLSAKTESQS